MPIQIPQIRRIEFNDEEIGMGFNSESGLAIGTALEGFTVQGNPVSSGQEVFASISIVNSHEELMTSLGMSFDAQGRYGLVSASLKAKFSESTNYNSTSTILTARCVVENSLKRGKNFRVTPEAQALLNALRFDEFKTAFGDSFVRGLQAGGEYYCVIRITSVSTSKQSTLSAALTGEFNGLVASGSFKTEFVRANLNESTRSEYTATMYQKAGSGQQIFPTVEISEAITRYKTFPAIVLENPVAYETEVATYDTLPLPVPTAEEQEDFIFALRDAREKKLLYIQTRNDLEFARINPTFFEALPSNDVLSSAINVYIKLINAVMDHAIRLSRGQIRPPRVFDPSEVSPPIIEPTPIPLKRIQSATEIIVPNLIGISTFDLDYAFRALEVGCPIDEIINGTAHERVGINPPISPPINITREALEFLFLTTAAGGNIVSLSSNSTPTSHFAEHRIALQAPLAGSIVQGRSEVSIRIEPVV